MSLLSVKGKKSLPIVKIPNLEWCNVAKDGNVKKFPLLRIFFDKFKDQLSSLQQCPIFGTISMQNFQLKTRDISIYPTGTYRFSFIANVSTSDDINDHFNLTGLAGFRGSF